MQPKIVLVLTAIMLTAALPLNAAAEETLDDIPTIASGTGAHNSLVAALAHVDLVETLGGEGPFTVFAPTDEAFNAVDFNISEFSDDYSKEVLKFLLLHHVVIGHFNSSDLSDGMEVTMASGSSVTVSITEGVVSVGNATVSTANVQASNGVIHVIDSVLSPSDDDIDRHVTMVLVDTDEDGVVSVDEFLTMFEEDSEEPMDNETRAYLTGMFYGYDIDNDTYLDYDELMTFIDDMEEYEGGETFVCDNGEEIPAEYVNDGEADCSDGSDESQPQGPPGEICYNVVSHTIDVLADQATCEAYMYFDNYTGNGMENFTGCYNMVSHAVSSASQAECEGYMWTPSVSIAMTAAATGIHSSLVAALGVASLVETLSGEANYTVFAPTDEAFAAAGIDLSTYTTEEQIAKLADILLYHVVAGTVMSSDLASGETVVQAANEDDLTITVNQDGVFVGAENAKVIIADVPVSNGVIHVIDTVIMPPADEPVGPVCDVTVGIASSGFAFSPASVTIEVGQTVCWEWTDSESAHNVIEVDGFKSTTYVTDGISSGEASTTVKFAHTFTEDTTFYYACQPHVGMDMFGKVTVGNGSVEPAEESQESEEAENTPGFLGITVIVATIGALMVASSREEE